MRALAKEMKIRVKDVLALSSGVDPFYQSREANPPDGALWFSKIYKWFKKTFPKNDPYLRSIHYLYSSLKDVTRHDGTPYLNDKASWSYLKKWSLIARYCKLINRGDLMDNRKNDPVLLADFKTPHREYGYAGYSIGLQGQSTDRINTLNFNIGYSRYNDAKSLAKSLAEVYSRKADDISYNIQKFQPYHLEVWIEKGSLNKELIPVCRKFHANFIYGLGQESLTRVDILLDRIYESKKPIRIFYICDYDEQGTIIPEAVARKIQYYNDTLHNGELNIKLHHLCLTLEQIKKYDLPRKPTGYAPKEKTLAQLSGENQTKYREQLKKYNVGLRKRQPFAVELNALEAFHPGETAKLLTNALSHFYDLDLEQKIMNKSHDFRENVKAHIYDNVLLNEDEINKAISLIDDRYAFINSQLDLLHNAAVKQKEWCITSELYDAIKQLQNEYVDLDEIDFNLPKAKVTNNFEGNWLYNNTLNYWDQTMRLKNHRKRTGEN